MGQFVIELNALSAPSATATIYFAIGPGIAFDTFYVPGGAVSWAAPTQKVELGASGVVSTTDDQGAIVIANMADTMSGAGALDAYLRGYGFGGQTARLWYCPDAVWTNKVQVDSGFLEQPVATGGAQASLRETVMFNLRDFRAALDVPFQTLYFSGDGTAPEGDVSLHGKPKPICYGFTFNVSIPQTSASLLMYSIGLNGLTTRNVTDGALPITIDVGIYSNMTTFQAASVAAGHCILFQDSGTYGCYIRLGSKPTFALGANVEEDPSVILSQTHASIWSRMSTVLGRSVDSTSVSAANGLDSAHCGFYWGVDSVDTARQAIDKVLQSFSGYEVYDPIAAKWKIGKLVAPDHSNTITLQVLTPTVRLAAGDRKLISASVARPPWTINGVPPYQVTLHYGLNYAPLVTSQIAGSVTMDISFWYQTQWQATTAKISSAGIWSNPGKAVIETGYSWSGTNQAAVDAERDRLLNLMQQYNGYFQVSWIPQVYPTADKVLVGDVVKMVLPRYGNPSAQYYRVMQTSLKVDANGPVMNAVIGLESA